MKKERNKCKYNKGIREKTHFQKQGRGDRNTTSNCQHKRTSKAKTTHEIQFRNSTLSMIFLT
jgi:hypothetical protein